MKTVKMETTEGIDIAWHLEGDEVVMDRSNVPLDEETFDTIWPGWMFEKTPKR